MPVAPGTKIYRGIDIAGDGGRTGVADIIEDVAGLRARVYESGFGGLEGLQKASQPDRDGTLMACAVDQPLGFPHATFHLLMGHSTAGDQTYDPGRYRYRRADEEMRRRIAKVRPKRDYVLPPPRCENIWRALYLLRLAKIDIAAARLGKSTWFETHPRLCVAELLADDEINLVARYKSKPVRDQRAGEVIERSIPELGMLDARRLLLDRVVQRLSLSIPDDDRDRAVRDDNAFEALFAAVAALAFDRKASIRYPSEELAPAQAACEGYVYVPDWSRVSANRG